MRCLLRADAATVPAAGEIPWGRGRTRYSLNLLRLRHNHKGWSPSVARQLAKPRGALEPAPPPVHVSATLEQVPRARCVVLLDEIVRFVLLAVSDPGEWLDLYEV